MAEAEADQAEQANDLRLVYGLGLLLVMLIQIAGADYIFYRYASSASVHWDVPGSTMNVWLSATVVQVIAIVGIVVHYLFPNQEVRGRRTRRSSAQPQ